MLSKKFKIASVFLLLFSFISSSAQIKVARINVYFEKNSYTISERMASKLHRVSDSVESWEVEKIYLHGSADGDASSDYNLKLSKERCNSVAMFLTDYGADPNVIALTAHGERIDSEESTSERRKARERRVQIVIGYRTIIPKQAAPDTITQDTIITPMDTCTRDTLLDMGDGVFAKMNLCEYEENKACLKVQCFKNVRCTEVKTNKFKMRMGFRHYRKCVNPYVAFSYFVMTCNDSCFKKPIFIYTPTKIFKTTSDIRKFQRNFSERTKRVKVKGEKYLQVKVSCPGFMDCGTRPPLCKSCGKKKKPIKIKLKNKITLVGDYYPKYEDVIEEASINCCTECKNNLKLIYPKSLTIDSLVIQYKDSIYVISDIMLDDLRPSWLRCRRPVRKIRRGNEHYFLGFRHKSQYRYVYKRTKSPKYYKIRPKDLESLTKPSWKPSLEDLLKD